MTIRILTGDMRERLRELPDNSVDAVVTDPPYHLTSIVKRFGGSAAKAARRGKTGAYARASRGFMGQQWDGGDVAFQAATWREVLRVLKPGGHVVAFSGSRTYHLLGTAIAEAGFEVRDGVLDAIASDDAAMRFMASLDGPQVEAFLRCVEESRFGGMLAWVYGSGFPKSHDVSKGIDRHNGDARPVVGSERISNDMRGGALLDVAHGVDRPGFDRDVTSATSAASAASAAWDGWGTALKPAFEPIVLARKPLVGSVAANVLAFGTGALNIDGCRVGQREKPKVTDPKQTSNTYGSINSPGGKLLPDARWPANVIHDGSDEVVAAFPAAPGQLRVSSDEQRSQGGVYGAITSNGGRVHLPRADSGSAARFFYSAKADGGERHAGTAALDPKEQGKGNSHPTVKPVDVMRWLVRLITPPGGTVLDPFMGSGSTLIAADAEQFDAIGVELSPHYVEIARARIAQAAGMFAQVEVA